MKNLESTEVVLDLEFEISGEGFAELEWSDLKLLKNKNHEVAIAIEKTLMRNFWEITSLEKLKSKLRKNLNFLDLTKIKLDFSEKQPNRSGFFMGAQTYSSTIINAIERIPEILTNKLFGWIYYTNEDESIETFRFIVNIETGEIKYFD